MQPDPQFPGELAVAGKGDVLVFDRNLRHQGGTVALQGVDHFRRQDVRRPGLRRLADQGLALRDVFRNITSGPHPNRIWMQAALNALILTFLQARLPLSMVAHKP